MREKYRLAFPRIIYRKMQCRIDIRAQAESPSRDENPVCINSANMDVKDSIAILARHTLRKHTVACNYGRSTNFISVILTDAVNIIEIESLLTELILLAI